MSRSEHVIAKNQEVVIGPIYAWRAWIIFSDKQDLILQSLTFSLSQWPPREPMRAKCLDYPHRAPYWRCNCGIYASQYAEVIADSVASFMREGFFCSCVGRVALWGKIIEYQRGYRAEYAYPTSLILFNDKRLRPWITMKRLAKMADCLEKKYGVPCRGVELDSDFAEILIPKIIRTEFPSEKDRFEV